MTTSFCGHFSGVDSVETFNDDTHLDIISGAVSFDQKI